MTDYISRADAIEAVECCEIRAINDYRNFLLIDKNDAKDAIESLPSADADRPKVVGIDYSPYRIQTTALSADAISRKDTVTLNSPISIQADMVAVVRCKDCRWQNISRKSGRNICGRENGLILADDNNYCSYGERREP